MERLDSSYFDWLTWRCGNPVELFSIACRSDELQAGSGVLQRYAVGWCPSEEVPCRPKTDHVSVMFCKDGSYGWFHLRRQEFEEIFCEN